MIGISPNDFKKMLYENLITHTVRPLLAKHWNRVDA